MKAPKLPFLSDEGQARLERLVRESERVAKPEELLTPKGLTSDDRLWLEHMVATLVGDHERTRVALHAIASKGTDASMRQIALGELKALEGQNSFGAFTEGNQQLREAKRIVEAFQTSLKSMDGVEDPLVAAWMGQAILSLDVLVSISSGTRENPDLEKVLADRLRTQDEWRTILEGTRRLVRRIGGSDSLG